MQAVLGIGFLLLVLWLISESRSSVQWRPVAVGLSMQFLLAFLFLGVPAVSESLMFANKIVYAIERATVAGTGFVFGYLGGGGAPFEVSVEGALYVFAFRVLPQILLFSVLVAVLWYWRILPMIVNGFGLLLRRALGVGGAVGTAAAASVFLGMVESPLVIRAYLQQVSRSEFFTVMTCGMATVAGSIMVLYANVLLDVIPGALGHILAASVLNVVGAVVLSRIFIPSQDDTDDDQAQQSLRYSSNMDAITRGTADGLLLAVNVGAMLVVLVSLVALVNQGLGLVSIAEAPLTLERLMGWIFAPMAWLIGIPWVEAQAAGALLGSKLILNELVAFLELAALTDTQLSSGSRLIMMYTLCGFANFGSLGIMLGGLTTLVPERRSEILSIGPKALIAGTIVNLNTGAIVALVSLY